MYATHPIKEDLGIQFNKILMKLLTLFTGDKNSKYILDRKTNNEMQTRLGRYGLIQFDTELILNIAFDIWISID